MQFPGFFHNIKIQRQLFTTLLFLFSVPVLSIGLFLVINTRSEMTDRYLEQTDIENSRIRSVLFDVTTNLYNISENLVADTELVKLLSYQYRDENEVRKKFDQYKEIQNILSQQTAVYEIKIYTNNSSIQKYSNIIYCDEEVKNTDWYRCLSADKSCLWKSEPVDHQGYPWHNLTLYRLMPLPLAKEFAIIKISVSGNYLKNHMDNPFIPSIITVNEDLVFYDNTALGCEGTMPVSINCENRYYQSSGRIKIRNMEGLYSVSTLHPYRSDDYMYIFSFSPQAARYIKKVTMICFFILALAFSIPCALLYLYTGYFSARIDLLREAMHKASQENYNIIESFAGNDELSETFYDLRTMIRQVQYKEACIYQSEIREQKLINRQQEMENRQQQMEFKILTSQINPHFLYNTLETLRMKAFNEGNEEVATAIKLLGRYLHYALESIGTSSTTLATELYYIEIYLKIQKMRFKERINYRIVNNGKIDTSQYLILPFLLQPVVENSVLHGVEGLEQRGMIEIKIEKREKRLLYISVIDNGEGMTWSETEDLRKSINKKDISKTRSIGLYNINQRIRLSYGEEYGLTIESQKNIGTKITLCLPVIIDERGSKDD